MQIAAMGKEMFDYLIAAKAIKKSGVNYKLGPALVIVDGKRTGLKVEIKTQE